MQVVSYERGGAGVGCGGGVVVMDWVVWARAEVCFMSSFMLISHVICAGALHQDGLINLC